MLKNLKNIALFYTDYNIPDNFTPYLEKGVFKLKKIKLLDDVKNDIFYYYIIYNPVYANEARLLKKILKKNFYSSFNENYERKIGKLLGYKREDVEFYIQNFKRYLSELKTTK
ncbi:hemocin immunity protein [Rodentibacter caecimuris]|uniref:Hemocin immunity protein n=1 Tax=Rodentibacter caecimuris TaxID=1796644 RepID=A0ABX3L0U7_9PAST|nr:hemocin immunity protein [Rodentibacter heylii]